MIKQMAHDEELKGLSLMHTTNQAYFITEKFLEYSGTPLNGHPSTADTHDIMDSIESPDRFSIHFNILKNSE